MEGDTLLSLDVVSLFTNVPVNYALESIKLRWVEIQQFTTVPEQNFMIMLELVLSSTFFAYKGRFYKQRFGLPMGSPLSPVVANIVLERIENSAINQLTNENRTPTFFKRYVHDCLASIQSEHVDRMLEVFNSFHPRIQFTIEMEENSRLKFLDTIVRKENGRFTTEWAPKDVDG